MHTDTTVEPRHESKTRFLEAATHVIRSKGYTATRIEDVCEEAGLTKGSFFHHFKSKEDLAREAAEHWLDTTTEFFLAAEYHSPSDPLERLLAYVDFRISILQGDLSNYTCLVGTMVQEVYSTNPTIREACRQSITAHASTLEADIAACMQRSGIEGEWTPESLGLYTQATVQGAFILAKATGSTKVAAECLGHLRRYLELLFQPTRERDVD
jgi:TetR/AcrR family transcriptional repressor of nem operon